MEDQMPFPNPVKRTDLPVKRRRWPRLVVAGMVLVLLCIAFLPQIMQTRVGRRLLRAKLESKYNAEISIQEFSTSWLGGTSATQFWIKSSDSRIIGFNHLKSDLSLWKLLRGNYDLGNCSIDGLIVDYVLDSGDDAHRDTYERLTGALPRTAGSPPAPLAHLSGKIILTNAQLNLYRSHTDPNTLNLVHDFVRFTNISGQLDIAALDRPWTYNLAGSAGITGEERGQGFESSGSMCLGQGGAFVPEALQVDASFKGTNVPTSLATVVLAVLSPEDCRTGFGPTFDHLEFTVKGDGGVLRLDVLADAAEGHGHIHLQPAFDLKTTPATLTMSSNNPDDNLIAAGIGPGPARAAMGRVNPFATYADSGIAVLRIASLRVPVSQAWSIGSAKAELELHDVKLSTPRETSEGEGPTSLPGQLSLLTGDLDASPALQPMPVPFSLENGAITITPAQMKVGEASVGLSGGSTSEGKLQMKLNVTSPQLASAVAEFATGTSPALEVPLIGTVEQPKLDLEAMLRTLPTEPAQKLRDWIAHQQAAIHTRDIQAAQREKEKKVQELIKPFAPDKPSPP